jgi:hypothetical protein
MKGSELNGTKQYVNSLFLIKFWFVTVIPKYLNFATFWKELVAVFLWFCPAFWWWDMKHVISFLCIYF